MNHEICLITLGGGQTPVLNTLKILSQLCSRVHWICARTNPAKFNLPSNVTPYKIEHKSSSSSALRLLRFFLVQLNITWYAALLKQRVQLYFFFIGGAGMVIPATYLRLVRKRAIMMLGGWAHKVIDSAKDKMVLPFKVLMRLTFNLMQNIVVYSNSMSKEVEFFPREKLIIASEHTLDFSLFSCQSPVEHRNLLIGYVGRLSDEKGIISLLKATILCNAFNREVGLIVVGTGPLKGEVESWATAYPSTIEYLAHLPHEDIPEIMDRLKLLVIPSATEGLPNVMLEAMACGTPVLASPVGAIPDYLKHDETGFLLNSTQPERMADQILSVLEDLPALKRISANARRMVNEYFTFEQVLARWKNLLREVLK